ncbi:hypothetical protein ANN_13507 [Periplaneta americana]|uniref:Per a allergen n=1 Tax=Periplaneta americana TaxID=6978 RepID=A0ABQ8TLP1_PERAM|nr:hypothetical protein ANN_13507 [Periplaneta americana]
MEEEVERIVIYMSSDKECDEDEMYYDRPADSPRIETERIAFTKHERPHLKTAMFPQTGYAVGTGTVIDGGDIVAYD